jgi:P-type Ca2+ transporter type 2C
VIAVW